MSKKRAFILTVVILVLILIIAGAAFGTAKHMRRTGRNSESVDLHNAEEEYIKEVRQALREQGVDRAGVMLTSVTDESGVRIYTLSVHHRLFGSEKLKERGENAIRALDEIRMDVPRSRIEVKPSA
ncbi:MAG: hypothetical protein K6F53_03340 [Lachnospiraceae bacterium]|nr:hypothetical protein [Lachnospiraceae bacterium]